MKKNNGFYSDFQYCTISTTVQNIRAEHDKIHVFSCSLVMQTAFFLTNSCNTIAVDGEM